MIKAKLMLVSENVIRDVETNLISAINIIEQITVETLPTIVPKLVMLTVFERDAEDDKVISCGFEISLSGKILSHQHLDINFQDALQHTSIITVQGLPIENPGILEFSLSLEDRLISDFQMNVIARQTPSIKTTQA